MKKMKYNRSEFREAAISLRTPLGERTLEGHVAERKTELLKGFEVREIRFWIDRRRAATSRRW